MPPWKISGYNQWFTAWVLQEIHRCATKFSWIKNFTRIFTKIPLVFQAKGSFANYVMQNNDFFETPLPSFKEAPCHKFSKEIKNMYLNCHKFSYPLPPKARRNLRTTPKSFPEIFWESKFYQIHLGTLSTKIKFKHNFLGL